MHTYIGVTRMYVWVRGVVGIHRCGPVGALRVGGLSLCIVPAVFISGKETFFLIVFFSVSLFLVFVSYQISSFFQLNLYVPYALVRECGVSDPQGYLKKEYPEGFPLHTVYVHRQLFAPVEATIQVNPRSDKRLATPWKTVAIFSSFLSLHGHTCNGIGHVLPPKKTSGLSLSVHLGCMCPYACQLYVPLYMKEEEWCC